VSNVFESLLAGPPPPLKDGEVLIELHATEDAMSAPAAGFYLETAAWYVRRGTMQFTAVVMTPERGRKYFLRVATVDGYAWRLRTEDDS
jgi:hypothetical protein